MCGEAVENVDEAEDGGGQARHKDDIELKYPGAADEGGDDGDSVAEDKKDDGSDNCGCRAYSEGGILFEGGGEYEEAGDGQLGFMIWR